MDALPILLGNRAFIKATIHMHTAIFHTIRIALILVFMGSVGCLSAREPVDKTAYQGTLWVQANPWFPPVKSRLIAPLGGPNYAMKRYEDKGGWLGAVKQLSECGVTGLQMELIGGAFWETFMDVLNAAEKSGTDFKLSIFETRDGNTFDDVRNGLTALLERLNPILRNHPNVYRLDGRPVIIIYQTAFLKPEQWTGLFDELEAKYGKIVWLFVSFDGASLNTDLVVFESYLEVFDGISNYCCFSEEGQREHYAMVSEVMKRHPEKIFEAGVHNAYMSHFHNGGFNTDLSHKFRASLDIDLEAGADSLTLTNLFDHYENSLFLPCYEREDFLLKYTACRLAEYRGETVGGNEPELVVVTDINLRLGEDLNLDLVTMPVSHDEKTAEVDVTWCDADGHEILAFPTRLLNLEQAGCERFSVKCPLWSDVMAVTPRVTLRWNGTEKVFAPHTMTTIQPTMRSNNMYWARSSRNQLKVVALAQPEWTLNGAGPGSRIAWGDGLFVFRAMVAAVANQNIDQIRIMRNGREFATLEKHDLMFEHALILPCPGDTWDAYHLELENRSGCRYQTLPVFVALAPDDNRDVEIPVFCADGAVRRTNVDERRLADFRYPMERDNGVLLLDHSGYQHHAYLGGAGYGGGHLKFTGYHFEHSGTVEPQPPPAAPKFGYDDDGRGFLAFDGAQHVSMMAATMPPYASCVELEVRPRAVGTPQDILAVGNKTLRLHLDEQGRLHAVRQGLVNGETADAEIVSRASLKADAWHSIKVIYDLARLALFVDGDLQGSVDVAPMQGSDRHNFMLLGCGIANFWDPAKHFTGDIRALYLHSHP